MTMIELSAAMVSQAFIWPPAAEVPRFPPAPKPGSVNAKTTVPPTPAAVLKNPRRVR